MAAPVPGIEVPDDTDPPSVRCPDGEGDAVDPFHLDRVRAELLIDALVASLREEIGIKFA
jgi:hypothetical protein